MNDKHSEMAFSRNHKTAAQIHANIDRAVGLIPTQHPPSITHHPLAQVNTRFSEYIFSLLCGLAILSTLLTSTQPCLSPLVSTAARGASRRWLQRSSNGDSVLYSDRCRIAIPKTYLAGTAFRPHFFEHRVVDDQSTVWRQCRLRANRLFWAF